MRISVIIPTLNEADRIGRRLEELRGRGFAEVLVVDGGSKDGTADRARGAGAQVLQAPRGRASQLNAGAAAAQGDVLLFLHADCQLPPGAVGHVAAALAGGSEAGAFTIHTVAPPDSSRRWLAPWLRLSDVRSRYTPHPYGDQAIFVRRAAFAAVGGFPEQPLMEDLEISRRLARRQRIARVHASVRVSGRRFLAAPIRYTLMVNLFPLLYRLGVDPARMARLYRDVR